MGALLNWYHLDLYADMYSARHLQRLLDQLQEMGCNGIVLELANRLHYRSVPDFGASDALSREEFRSFCDRIRSHGMTVVPLLQHVGHLGHLLKHPAYRALREEPATAFSLCPLHPDARPTLEKILLETVEAAGPVEYVHLGGDEAYHLGHCPRCKAFVAQHSKSKLYMQHYVPLCRRILDLGKRPILWHDMVTAHPECLDELPRQVILLDWKYARDERECPQCMLWRHPHITVTAEEFEKVEPAEWRERFRPYFVLKNGLLNSYYSAEYLKAQGFNVILGSAARSAGDSCFFPNNGLHLPNVAQTARHARELNMLGVCLTDWSVRQNSPGTRMLGIYTGIAALARGLTLNAAAERFAVECCGLPEGGGEQILAVSAALSHTPPLSAPDHGYRDADSDAWHGQDIPRLLQKFDIGKARAEISALRGHYRTAQELLPKLQAAAREPGKTWLQEWELAVESLQGRLDTLEAILDRAEGKLSEQKRHAALQVIARLENRTREILGPIYTSEALQQQLAVRFGGERAFLS